MSVADAWSEIKNWMQLYKGSNPAFLIITILALIYLLFFNKSVRKTIIFPIIVLVPIIINPLLYKYAYRSLRYWRFFWILSEAVIIGLAFADLSRRISNKWIKCLSLLAVTGLFILLGSNIFLTESYEFQPADNPHKVSAYVKQNCDIILADNPAPKCIFQSGYVETRVYSGKIHQIHGRDIDGYIIGPSEEARKVHANWNGKPEEQEYIFTVAQEQDYTHICCRTTDGFDEMAEAHGFSVLSKTEEWTIYHRKL